MPHLRLTPLLIAHAVAAQAMVTQLHVTAPMRDGVLLSANIYRPSSSAPVPTILIRTPYQHQVEPLPNYVSFVNHGYAVVVQDVRGRNESQGVFAPLTQEGQDGNDTLNWIAKQPWSDGKIGMRGGSYLGIAQWKVALLGNPHLKAMFPAVSGDDDYRDRFYSPGGAMKLGHRLLWMEQNLRDYEVPEPEFTKYVSTIPLRRADIASTGRRSSLFQQVLDHPDFDSFWQGLSVQEQLRRVTVPVFSVGGWYDNYVESDLYAFSALQKQKPDNHILIGPWPHTPGELFDGVDFGPDTKVSLGRLELEWFDMWLKGKPPEAPRSPVRIFVMGADQWRDEAEWPLTRAQPTRLYLESGGRANSLSGDGELAPQVPLRFGKHAPPDTFTYDPRHATPTHGGAVCCTKAVFPYGPLDQRQVEMRSDVLVYSTTPLPADLEVTGNIQVTLFASSSAPDTDFTAKLVDVFPDGVARILTDGILRARYRNSLSKPELLKPGEITRFKIDAGITSNLFRRGHRIRIEIASSNFPRFDRNPNTGRLIADETELKPAMQTVYHDRKFASFVLLPVIPPERRVELPSQLTRPHVTRYRDH